MIRSMTGFGAGMSHTAGWRIDAVVRTLNHRFLSVRVRGISDRPWLQAQVERRTRSAFSRGEILLTLDVVREETPEARPWIDRTAVAGMYAELKELAKELELPEPPTLSDLIRTGVLQPKQEGDEELWPAVQAAVEDAIEAARDAREIEGEALRQETIRILEGLRTSIDAVTSRLPELTESIRRRLLDRVHELQLTLNEERLEAEVALLAERHDIQEEIARLRGHFERVGDLLNKDEPVGKELDFLGQEMLREVNTIGSKVHDADVGGVVIDMKVAVEQLREQVQNVE